MTATTPSKKLSGTPRGRNAPRHGELFWGASGVAAMARAAPRISHDRPQVSRSTARREIAAIRQLYRLNRELATDVSQLQRKRLRRESALMAFAILALAGI